MKNLELRKVKVHEDMSEETTCFTADLYDNGKLVAHLKNDGHGGDTMVHPAKGLTYQDIRQYDSMEMDIKFDIMCFEYESARKYQSKNIVAKQINAKENQYPEIVTYGLPSSHPTIAKVKQASNYSEWLKKTRKKIREQGYEIINRNL